MQKPHISLICWIMPSRVILWSTPRSLSTAFTKSIMQLGDVKIIHEPFDIPFHGEQERYKELPKVTFDQAVSELGSAHVGRDVFVKIITYHVVCKPAILFRDEFRQYKHVLLIRNPRETCISSYKLSLVCPDLFPASQWRSSSQLVYYKDQVTLYKHAKENWDEEILIFDAGDLLSNPEDVMQKFCTHVGYRFDPKMLTWEPGEITGTENIPWKICHEAATKSKGFHIPRTSEELSLPNNIAEEIREFEIESAPYYNFLYEKRYRPGVTKY